MKTIRLSVTDAEYAARKAVRRNERIARRALRELESLAQRERLYNLKTEDGYIGVLARLTDFDVTGYTDGVDVSVSVRLRPFDEASAVLLTDLRMRALEAKEDISAVLSRSLPATLKRDITALLDWVSPAGVPLWRGSICVYDETFEKERYQRYKFLMERASATRGLDDPSAAE